MPLLLLAIWFFSIPVWKDIPQTGLGTKDFIAPDSFDFRQSRSFRVRGAGGHAPFNFHLITSQSKGGHKALLLLPVQPFLELNMTAGESPLSMKADFLLSLCELVVGGRDGLQPIEKTVIDRCVRLVYREQALGIENTKTPLLQDLYEELLRQPEPEARRLSGAISITCPPSRRTSGAYSPIGSTMIMRSWVTRNTFKSSLLAAKLLPLPVEPRYIPLADFNFFQRLENDVFTVGGIAQKYNCALKRLDWQQEQGFMSSLALGCNEVEIKRGMTTSSTAIFILGKGNKVGRQDVGIVPGADGFPLFLHFHFPNIGKFSLNGFDGL